MAKLVIAFDVDDTLIVPAVATGFDRDVPNYDTIAVYRWFQTQGHTMIIWSGDIAFDDSDIEVALVNVKVKRLNNKVIRYPERISSAAIARKEETVE